MKKILIPLTLSITLIFTITITINNYFNLSLFTYEDKSINKQTTYNFSLITIVSNEKQNIQNEKETIIQKIAKVQNSQIDNVDKQIQLSKLKKEKFIVENKETIVNKVQNNIQKIEKNSDLEKAIHEYFKGNKQLIKNININELDRVVDNELVSLIFYLKAVISYEDNNYKLAISLYEKSIEQFKHFSNIYGYAQFLYFTKNYSKSIEYYNQSLNYTTDLLTKSIVKNEIGLSYLELNSKKAIMYLKEAISIKEEYVKQSNQSKSSKVLLANSLNNLGNIFKEIGNLKEALVYYKKALRVFIETNSQYKESIVLNGIGKVYLENLKYQNITFTQVRYLHKQAIDNFNRSLEIQESLDNNNRSVIISKVDNLHKLALANIILFQNLPKGFTDEYLETRIIGLLNRATKENKSLYNENDIFKENLLMIFNEYAIFEGIRKNYDTAYNKIEEALSISNELIKMNRKVYLSMYVNILTNSIKIKQEMSKNDKRFTQLELLSEYNEMVKLREEIVKYYPDIKAFKMNLLSSMNYLLFIVNDEELCKENIEKQNKLAIKWGLFESANIPKTIKVCSSLKNNL